MTYATDEESVQSGAPIEVYTFTRNGVGIGWYTSAEAEVMVGSELYSTWPGGLARSAIDIGGDEGRRSLNITVARDFPIADLIHLRPRTGVIGVTVQRYHRADAADITMIWAGRVLTSKRDRNAARVLICEPRSVSYNRNGLTRKCAPNCQHQLYGPRCRLSQSDWGYATTISAVSGTTLTVAAVESGMPYTGGIVERTDADGITDVAYIVEASGTVLTLDLALYGAAVSDSVIIYPGCDWTMNTCHNTFGNSANYGGRLNIPSKNPVTDSAFA
ncbi:MAG: phage BR0599 family protein [Pseudomonadales bacterium]|nr:phage BR0599 family protein [Pseudomonadales bacterium]